MKKRPVFVYTGVGLFVVLVLVAVFGFHVLKGVMIKKAFAHFRLPPATVSMTRAKKTEWTSYIEAIGSLRAVNGVNVSNELAGKVVKISFKSGEKVHRGQLLVQLDDSQEQALLRQYQAQATLDKLNYQRALTLRRKNLNSKQSLDQARGQYAMAGARVAAEQAVIAKKAIRAPFRGVLGIRQANLGQYLQPGATIVNLEQLSPLHLDFTLPQSDSPRVHGGQKVEITVNAFPNKLFFGRINAINPAVNVQSRTLAIQATLENQEDRLKPGMYADIRIIGDTKQVQTVVPVTAITYSLYGDSVYVLSAEKATTKTASMTPAKGRSPTRAKPVYMVRQVFVKTGETRGNWVSVSGIKPGERIVTAGQLKLRNGARVVINNQENPLAIPRELTP